MPRARRPRQQASPSLWSNSLVTALIRLGPAIEDSASGKHVLLGAAMRTSLFVGIALCGWGTVRLLERWSQPSGSPTPPAAPEGEIA